MNARPQPTTTGEHEAALIGSIVVRPSVLDQIEVSAADFCYGRLIALRLVRSPLAANYLT